MDIPSILAASSSTLSSSDAAAALLPCGITSIFGIIYILVMLLSIAFSIGLFIGWVLMIIDVAKRDAKDFPPPNGPDQKTMWILIVVLASYIGAAIYYFMVYRQTQHTKSVVK